MAVVTWVWGGWSPRLHTNIVEWQGRGKDVETRAANRQEATILSTLSLARAWEWGLEAKQGVQAIQYHKEGKKGRKGWEREVRRTYLYKAKCKIPCAQEIIVT